MLRNLSVPLVRSIANVWRSATEGLRIVPLCVFANAQGTPPPNHTERNPLASLLGRRDEQGESAEQFLLNMNGFSAEFLGRSKSANLMNSLTLAGDSTIARISRFSKTSPPVSPISRMATSTMARPKSTAGITCLEKRQGLSFAGELCWSRCSVPSTSEPFTPRGARP